VLGNKGYQESIWQKLAILGLGLIIPRIGLAFYGAKRRGVILQKGFPIIWKGRFQLFYYLGGPRERRNPGILEGLNSS